MSRLWSSFLLGRIYRLEAVSLRKNQVPRASSLMRGYHAFQFAPTVRRAVRFPSSCTTKLSSRSIRNFARDLGRQLRHGLRTEPLIVGSAIIIVILFIPFGYYYLKAERFIKTVWPNVPREVTDLIQRAVELDQHEQHEPALRKYREALRKALDLGMDPLSDEVFTFKFLICSYLKKLGRYQDTFDAYSACLPPIEQWLQLYGSEDSFSSTRRRLLAISIAIEVQMGKLAGDQLNDMRLAEKHLTHAVETALKEEARQAQVSSRDHAVNNGPTFTETQTWDEAQLLNSASEGRWLNKLEIAALLHELGSHFALRSKFEFAVPLFLRAITLLPPDSCEAVMLMFVISSCLAQVWPKPEDTNAPSRPQLVSNARQWAEKAIYVASNIQPPQRNRACDLACVFATHNLGELAEMENNHSEAEQRYTEARSLAQALNLTDAEKAAMQGLNRIRA